MKMKKYGPRVSVAIDHIRHEDFQVHAANKRKEVSAAAASENESISLGDRRSFSSEKAGYTIDAIQLSSNKYEFYWIW